MPYYAIAQIGYSDGELYHHGIKGQKWGVRRYQNSDGSLTDEGRRRYGYGTGSLSIITENTKSRMKQGTKLGAKVGLGLGIVGGALTTAGTLGFGAPVGFAIASGASYVAGRTASGALDGLVIGSIAGAVETHKGRKYIERYDDGLRNFEMRDLKRK